MEKSIETVRDQVRKSASVKQAMLEDEVLLGRIAEVADLCVEAYKAGHKVIWAGNGGSAADAQHMAGELVGRFAFDRPGLPSIALTTDTSVITGIGNDYGFDQLFSRQLQANGAEGDVFVGISTSGNSRNLLEALRVCREKGIVSVALTGCRPCGMDEYDHVIKAPTSVTPRIQECQTLIGHILCGIIEQSLFGEK